MTRVRSAAFYEDDDPAEDVIAEFGRDDKPYTRERLAEILREPTDEYPFVPGLPSWLDPT